MTRALKGHILNNLRFSFPFRMILAGSSESGKTFFAGKLLQRKDIFEDNVSAVFYYYPCYLNEVPVSWHKILDVPVSYHVGLPTKKELTNLPKNSCIVIDDSFDEAIKSSAIDHLFRVISGKRRICVIIMTQNNFTKGKYGREIRNSCNFSVLFRNCCDVSINENIARMSGMKKAFDSASLDVDGNKYPYFFLDQSQQGQLTRHRLYTDIFGKYPTVWSLDGMKAYIVAAQDFELFFDVFSEGSKFSARENVNSSSEKSSAIKPESTVIKVQSDPIEGRTHEQEKSIDLSDTQAENHTESSGSDEKIESCSNNESSENGVSEIAAPESDPEDIVTGETTVQYRKREATRPIRRERIIRRKRFGRFV